MEHLQESGAQGRIRTTDTRIFSPLLYQLSYPGIDDGVAIRGHIQEPEQPAHRYSETPGSCPAEIARGSCC